MNFISKWFKRRGEKRAASSYVIGYDYAAGALLRGEKTAYDLEVESSNAAVFGETNKEMRAFDRGIADAVDKLVSCGAVNDNRLCADWPEGQNETKRATTPVLQSISGGSDLRYLQTDLGE